MQTPICPQDRKRVRFQQADAQELPDDLGKFGCIMSSMLLDRVEDPRRVLASLGNFLPSGGILVIICPYCVDDKFTSKVSRNLPTLYYSLKQHDCSRADSFASGN